MFNPILATNAPVHLPLRSIRSLLPMRRRVSRGYYQVCVHQRKHQRKLHHRASKARFEELQQAQSDLYPRIDTEEKSLTCRDFTDRYQRESLAVPLEETDSTLHGRVFAIRSSGSRLFFIDIRQDGQRLQAICNFRRLAISNLPLEQFKDCYKRITVGDILRIEGTPYRTPSGELSLLLSKLPLIVSPCLPPLPVGLQDEQSRARKRHVDFLVNPSGLEVIRVRSTITQYLRSFLLNDGQIEVQTPIITAEAGGAAAKPFMTTAKELGDRNLNLRIAPELWLKRMIIGGFDRVFEIGPSFRNEGIENQAIVLNHVLIDAGIDTTHNPEFTTCEFYRAFTNIETLIKMTENFLCGLDSHLQKLRHSTKISLTNPSFDSHVPFRRLDFIPALQGALGRQLPDLKSTSARRDLAEILTNCSLENDDESTIPQMLDRLCSVYLEPQCQEPTFIVNHPECLSPLSKSFTHPEVYQRVAARAELFVRSTELINMYEEENSPLEQRRKFHDQLRFSPHSAEDQVNESYLEALEWGLPPTGGWGCGIERLCMLMIGTRRISEVISFGTLRHVASLGIQ